jgi:hypothetical protein
MIRLIPIILLTSCASVTDPEPIGYIDCMEIKGDTYCEFRELDEPEPWVNV